ncbi:MAG: hydrogenase iron-sulfur subunit [Steroidobacteraceae bacterium]|nr:hydrogenase iron-sulfur subunit [Steroidobacteraceae bacterium]
MSLRGLLRVPFDGLDRFCARAFPPAWNPMAQLGAIGWFLFWIVTVSGIYLYVFFDTGVAGTWRSIEAITHDQWWAGGVMRSLHRYASDAMVVMVLVHLSREWAMDRMRGNHWFAWATGVPLILFIYVCGITGYWLVWDARAQYVAVASAQLLDALPIFGEPIGRNFLDQASVSDRFFTLMVYLHIAAPLLMLLFMWIHIARHARAKVAPARGLGAVILLTLTALSLAWPALSEPPADLDRMPEAVPLDWFYLGAYPVMEKWGAAAVWLGLAGLFALLWLLPWLPPRRTPPAAKVDLGNCNGCARCFADCPFGAISLAPRSDGRSYEQEAVVHPEQCMACGICVGSCPTATPMRSAPDFVAGIELPDRLLAALRREVQAAASGLAGDDRVIVFACEHGAAADAAGGNAARIALPCVGMLPPPFMDWILSRGLADGVMLAGCAAGDCHFRLGDRWTAERIAGQRDPWLRERVPRERIGVSWAARGDRGQREADLAAFRARLPALPAMARGEKRERAPARPFARRAWPKPLQWGAWAGVFGALAFGTGALASWPDLRLLQPDEAVISLSLRHAAHTRVECQPLTPEELMKLKPNMRRQVGCPRQRWPVYVELLRDGFVLYQGQHQPAGLWNDGPSTVLERIVVPAGRQALTVRLRDSGREQGFDHERRIEADLAPAQNFVIEFRGGQWSLRP